MHLITQILNYFTDNFSYIFHQFETHLFISFLSVLFTFIIAFPTGIFLTFHKQWATPIISVITVIQNVPSLAMLTLMLMVFGLGNTTVIVTVVLYSLLPIVENTYKGIDNVKEEYVDSAKGIGMNKWQVLFMVKLPLALPVILAGIKNALVVAVGIATIGSFVGAGGLGDIILRGINITDGTAVIIVGALLCAVIVILLEAIIDWINKGLAKSID